MSRSNTTKDDLEEVHELNALFLDFLRVRALSAGDCLGLSRNAARLLQAAPPDLVETIARFPSALFRLNLDAARPLVVLDPRADRADPARLALQIAILHSAWSLSRRSTYGARLFLRLTEPEVRALRRLSLSEIQQLAGAAGVVRCAYRETDWLWDGLLSERRPESRRQLLLLGLQPQLGRHGDQSRGPLQTATA